MVAVGRTPMAAGIKLTVVLPIFPPILAVFLLCFAQVAAFPANVVAIAMTLRLAQFALFLSNILTVAGQFPRLRRRDTGQDRRRHQGNKHDFTHRRTPYPVQQPQRQMRSC